MIASRQPDLVLHVGMQQSGAAMVQRSLVRLRSQLRTQGVAFVAQPQISALAHAGGQLSNETPDRSDVVAFASELRQLVDDEREATAAVSRRRGPVLISSDLLLGSQNLGPADAREFRPLATRSIAQVIETVGATRVRVVLVVQRQDRLMDLCYLREVQGGKWGRLRDQFPRRFTPHFDYVELVERIAAVPNVTDVQVLPIELAGEDPRRFVDVFLACVGLQGRVDTESLPPDLRLRRTYSKRGVRVALAMIPHLETDRDRERLRAFMFESFSAENDSENRILGDEERDKVVAAHRVVNRRLFAGYRPDLPPDSYGTDEATAELGSIVLPAQSPLNGRARELVRTGVRVARANGSRGLIKINSTVARRHEQHGERR